MNWHCWSCPWTGDEAGGAEHEADTGHKVTETHRTWHGPSPAAADSDTEGETQR